MAGLQEGFNSAPSTARSSGSGSNSPVSRVLVRTTGCAPKPPVRGLATAPASADCPSGGWADFSRVEPEQATLLRPLQRSLSFTRPLAAVLIALATRLCRLPSRLSGARNTRAGSLSFLSAPSAAQIHSRHLATVLTFAWRSGRNSPFPERTGFNSWPRKSSQPACELPPVRRFLLFPSANFCEACACSWTAALS